jgi:ribonuclease Z
VHKLVAGFNTAYELDMGYRVDHHGVEAMNPATAKMVAVPFDVKEEGETVVLEDKETGLRISAFSVQHSPVEPAVGYKFSYLGRSIVVSGDCTADSPALRTAAQNCDILIHEAQANHILPLISQAIIEIDGLHPAGYMSTATRGARTIMKDIPSYHTSPRECAEIANAVNAKVLVMNHLTPPPANKVIEAVFARDVEGVRKKWERGVVRWVLGEDGLGWEVNERGIRRFSLI